MTNSEDSSISRRKLVYGGGGILAVGSVTVFLLGDSDKENFADWFANNKYDYDLAMENMELAWQRYEEEKYERSGHMAGIAYEHYNSMRDDVSDRRDNDYFDTFYLHVNHAAKAMENLEKAAGQAQDGFPQNMYHNQAQEHYSKANDYAGDLRTVLNQ